MNLKALVVEKGITQLSLAKRLGVNHTLLSLQLNNHRMLPEKYIQPLCEFLGITREQLTEATKGGKNE